MTLFQILERETPARHLDFLLIGAHAVNQYGYSRDTADVDLLVRRAERDAWLALFEGLNYRVFAEKPTFLQLEAPKDFVWPVDLMFVNDQTWEKMRAEAVEISIGNARCRVPKLLHLIALKVHALKHGHARRFAKDFQDVEGLISINRLDVASTMEQQNSTRKSPGRAQEIEASISRFVARQPDLDLPIEPSFVSTPPHLDPIAMYWRCEELMRQGRRPARRELRERVEVQFSL